MMWSIAVRDTSDTLKSNGLQMADLIQPPANRCFIF